MIIATKPSSFAKQREERVAEVLRENLRKRKQQQQARASLADKEDVSLKDPPHDLEGR